MHSESGKEKQSEETESKEDTNKSSNLSQTTQDAISTTVSSHITQNILWKSDQCLKIDSRDHFEIKILILKCRDYNNSWIISI